MSEECPVASCRPKGGIREVKLIDASKIENVSFGNAGRKCTGLLLSPQAEIQNYDILEERSSYTEIVTERNGFRVVKHSLKLVRGKVSSEEMFPVSEWMRRGCVALVTLGSGRRIVAGVSEESGCGYPLRVVSVGRDSGRSAGDGITEELLLESCDVSEASFLADGARVSVAGE